MLRRCNRVVPEAAVSPRKQAGEQGPTTRGRYLLEAVDMLDSGWMHPGVLRSIHGGRERVNDAPHSRPATLRPDTLMQDRSATCRSRRSSSKTDHGRTMAGPWIGSRTAAKLA